MFRFRRWCQKILQSNFSVYIYILFTYIVVFTLFKIREKESMKTNFIHKENNLGKLETLSHTNRAVFLPGWVESLLRDCSACKAPRGREGGEYQKIVVSYLVFIPRLASCPGSTIHGRLARVFCSDGSICFRTERLMPVIRYLLRSARMPGNHCTLARLQDAGG